MFTLKVDNTFISNMHMIDLSKMLSIANGYFAIQAINEHACMDLLNVIYHNVYVLVDFVVLCFLQNFASINGICSYFLLLTLKCCLLNC